MVIYRSQSIKVQVIKVRYCSQEIKDNQSDKSRSTCLRLLLLAPIFISMSACTGSQGALETAEIARQKETGRINAKNSARLATALQFFNEGKFGSAEQAYRLVIEKNPYDLEAWLGIAATYDNLKKYENANRAYMVAVKLGGYSGEILNNLGYHYILRGHYDKARKALTAADKKMPENPYVQNNLALLKQREAMVAKKAAGY